MKEQADTNVQNCDWTVAMRASSTFEWTIEILLTQDKSYPGDQILFYTLFLIILHVWPGLRSM